MAEHHAQVLHQSSYQRPTKAACFAWLRPSSRGSFISDVVHHCYGCPRQSTTLSLSLYADDADVFLTLVSADQLAIKEILRPFRKASGLLTNLTKSSFSPIRCNDQEIQLIANILHCNISTFPCKYLGLPLSLWRASWEDFQPLLDEVANRLQAWQVSLLSHGGRLVMVKSVLSTMPVYNFMALDPSPLSNQRN